MARDVMVLTGMPSTGGQFAQIATRHFGRPSPREGLPDRSVLIDGVTQDLSRLAAYNRLCGFGVSDAVSATWLHVQTFGLQLALMAERDFPFSLVGLVHVSNRMEIRRPVLVGERLRMLVTAENLRPHKRGAVFDIVGRVHVGDDLAWTGRSVYLAPGAQLPGEPEPAPRLTAPEVASSQKWKLPADLGRDYARVSGDANPIHLNPLTAKVFGFRRQIIHGMWTHARALAAFGGQLPDVYRVDVAFTKPIVLPGVVMFATDGRRFAVVNRDETKPYLVGAVAPG